MKRFVFLAAVLSLFGSVAFAGPDSPKQSKSCTLCVGVTSDAVTAPAAAVPLLIRADSRQLADRTAFITALSADQKARTVLAVALEALASVDQAETVINSVVDWAVTAGPFNGIAVSFQGTEPPVRAYALKKLAVSFQGRDLAAAIGFAPASVDELAPLYAEGAGAYFDFVLVDRPLVEPVSAWLTEHDPVKKIEALADVKSPNALFDAADALRAGATFSFLSGGDSTLASAAAAMNRELAGDYAVDKSASITFLNPDGSKRTDDAVSFVRGEDLRTLIVPQGDSAQSVILSVPDDAFTAPRRVDAARELRITDTGRRGGNLLVGLAPSRSGYVVTLDRPAVADQNVTKETISVATEKGITVEEIIRNHQSYWTFEKTITPRYLARNETKLRFAVAQGGESVEATIAGPHFFEPSGVNDWVWSDFYLNGVKWKYGKIPELPIIQPEKVTQLPLDIHLTNEYRYELVGSAKVRDYDAWEVRFEPPRNAPPELPLYRGTVWIDKKTWARLRISMIQLNLSGEVLSNEERVDYVPFDLTGRIVPPSEVHARSAKSILWLPMTVGAQQVLSTSGRSTVVLRDTTFSDLRLDPPDYDALKREADESQYRMVRDTDQGLRYLEKNASGQRVVKEGFDTSRLFLVGGIHHDEGLEFPVVPLGGVDQYSFNAFGRGLQSNIFFAGVLAAINVTQPSLFKTRTNFGADFFGIAVPTENAMYRDGTEMIGEKVKALPTSLALRLGHPFLNFGKIDLNLGISHVTYQRAQDTMHGFEVPADTFIVSPGIEARYDRWGYSVTAYYDHGMRTTWRPWGNLAEYDAKQKNYSDFGGSLGKSFYLPNFQRIALEVNYADGSNLDRFSKYELGYFGAQRVHGVKSGSVRAEKAIVAHASYGFVFSQQFRLEAFYDHALLDDEAAGYRREPFQGVGIAGQTIGPWGTLLRLDVGKMVGRNAQDGFVANIVFLKLFNR